MSLAPLVADDKVMVGVSGGELGVRGFVAAFDAETGKPAWKAYAVPAPGEPGSETWPTGDQWKTGGGSVWITGAYDPATNLTFWGTGNGGPWMGDQRPGNLYTSSTMAIDAATVTTALNRRPRGSASVLAVANTSTGSSLRSHRAVSKSWIITSRNSPTERRTYSIGGGVGSRLIIVSNSTWPIRPSRIWRSSRAKFGSKRRLKPTISGTPHPRAAAASLGAATIEVERLFAEHRLATPRRSLDEFGVGVGRAGHHYRVDGGVGERLRLAAFLTGRLLSRSC